jgi:hypothetical protein
VHAVVRLRLALARLAPRRTPEFNRHLRYAWRRRLATRSGHPSRPASLRLDRSATRRRRVFNVLRAASPQQSNAAHHAPAHKLEIDDMISVAGRVHALVMLASKWRAETFRVRSPPHSGGITPRITRPPAPAIVDDIVRVAGRVHALVRPPKCAGLKPPAHQARAFRRSNAAHHAPPQAIGNR